MTVDITTGLRGVEDMSQAAAGGTISRTRNVDGTSTTGNVTRFNASNFPILASADAVKVSNAGGAATYPGPAIGEMAGRLRAPVADVAALRALAVASCTDRQACYVDAKQAFYFFDAAATAADDGNLVIRPTDYVSAGNWVKASAGAADTATSATSAADANLLNGAVDAEAATPSTIAKRDSSGRLQSAEPAGLGTAAAEGFLCPLDATGKIPADAVPAGTPGAGSITTEMLEANAVTQFQQDSISAEGTTTSTSYVDMTGLEVTITTEGGPIRVDFSSGVISGSTTLKIWFAVQVDGTDYFVAGGYPHGRAEGQLTGFALISGLAAGTYTIKGRAKVNTGTGYWCYGSEFDAKLLVTEFKR